MKLKSGDKVKVIAGKDKGKKGKVLQIFPLKKKASVEGINLAMEIQPDLVICDILMPVVDGYKVKEKLSTNPKSSSIPFIFLSAKSDLCDIRKGMNLGADDYLTKPFKIADLLKAIEARINRIDEIGKQILGAKENQNENNSQKLDREDSIFIEADGKPTFIRINTIN